MDELRDEFSRLRVLKTQRRQRLEEFQTKLSKLKFLDPACGCGNFLVIAYRELRLLEIEVLQEINSGGTQLELDVSVLSRVDVDQFAGIEIGEFAARIAETAMWMMDHIMNNRLSLAFGKSYVRIPLKKSPRIHHGNALKEDWATVMPASECTHILGNPPFRGHQWRDSVQQEDMHRVWGRDGKVNRLDYVTCWFKRAVDYVPMKRKVRVGFVATNSISQGEQASILWSWLYAQGIHIHFAHRTFQWESESSGKAAVHCVIIGFERCAPKTCTIYDYPDIKGEPIAARVSQINAYLVEAAHILVPSRTKAPEGFPSLFQGSKPADGARLKDDRGKYVTTSNLILDGEEKVAALARDPSIGKWLRPYIGGRELLSGEARWCLWLKEITPSEIKASPEIQVRLERVKKGRLQSPTASVREFARTPWLFTQDRQPDNDYLGVPEVSSENRDYIPMAILPKQTVGSNKLLLLPTAKPWLFAIMTSAMHMGWMRTVTGRLESRYSYAPTVYNSFPWPTLTDKRKAALNASAQAILDARKVYPNSSLADLYDPNTMPAVLRKAHEANDKVVDRLYQKSGFKSERERIEHLFKLFVERAAPLEAKGKSSGA